MNAIKKIGVLMPIIQDPLDSELLQGIHEQAQQLGYDIIVFTNSTNLQNTLLPDDYLHGENNIYRLVFQTELDGVILAAGRFFDVERTNQMVDMLKPLKIPCLVLEKAQKHFPYIYPPQSEIFLQITNHLLEVHHSEKLYCLTGPKGNYQAEERLSGFIKAVIDAGIPPENYQVFYGDFWKDAAAELGERIVSGELPIPDAVVCANDVMAIVLCETLQENGINVPNQVKITGFDGHLLAMSHYPPITTAAGYQYLLGQNAVNQMHKMLTKESSAIPLRSCELHIGGSCGCQQNHESKKIVNQLIEHCRQMQKIQQIYVNSNYIIRLSEAESLEQFLLAASSLGHLLPHWQWQDLCICEDWMCETNNIRTAGYSDTMLLGYSKRMNHKDKTANYKFQTKQILPDLSKPHDPKFVIVTPIHYVLQVFGYLATTYENAADFRNDYFYNNWCDALANGLRALQEKLYTRKIEQQIQEYTSRDIVSGMYNRKGFTEQAQSFFLRPENSKGSAIMLFLHCHFTEHITDEMMFPMINALQLSCRLGELAARINTDTFVLLMPLTEQSSVQEQTERWLVQMERIVKMIYHQIKSNAIPEFIADNSILHILQLPNIEQLLDERLHILSKKIQENQNHSTDYEDKLKCIRREIRLDPQYDWRVSGIANRLGISVSYLQKIYPEIFGTTCLDDIINARIAKAKQLLKETNLRIQEIAHQCGYQNAGSFMKQFKVKTGMTAKEYRNSLKQSE